MNKVVSMEEIVPLMKEKIAQHGAVNFTPKGNSMLPMLRSNRDVVTLKQAAFPLKKYALVLYQRENGRYVLHRVVRVERRKQKLQKSSSTAGNRQALPEERYTMRGDNQFVDEPGIGREQVIGEVVAFVRDGHSYSCHALSYRIYCCIWGHTVILRKWLRRL